MDNDSLASRMRRRNAVVVLGALGIAALSFAVGTNLGQRSMLRSCGRRLGAQSST
jgi:hypothetical protein